LYSSEGLDVRMVSYAWPRKEVRVLLD